MPGERVPEKYRTTIQLPDLMKSWLQEITGVAHIVDWTDNELIIEFEVGEEFIPDEYNLGIVVHELTDTLNSLSMEMTTIERPVKQ